MGRTMAKWLDFRNMHGSTIRLDWQGCDERIISLKRRLRDQGFAKPPACLRLWSCGKHLRDFPTLSDYNIQGGFEFVVMACTSVTVVVSLLSRERTVVTMILHGQGTPADCDWTHVTAERCADPDEGEEADRLASQVSEVLSGGCPILLFQEGLPVCLREMDFVQVRCTNDHGSSHAGGIRFPASRAELFALDVLELDRAMWREIVRVNVLCTQHRACLIRDDQCTRWLLQLMQLPPVLAQMVVQRLVKRLVESYKQHTLEQCLQEFYLSPKILSSYSTQALFSQICS